MPYSYSTCAAVLAGFLMLPTVGWTDELSLTGGAGWGVGMFNGTGKDVQQEVIVAGYSRSLSNRLELLAEVQALINHRPHSGQYLGGALNFKYNFGSPNQTIRPYLLAGGGAGHLDADLEQSDGFNFLLQAAIGVTIKQVLRVEVRYHHISNAKTRAPNPGLNSIMILVGPRWNF